MAQKYYKTAILGEKQFLLKGQPSQKTAKVMVWAKTNSGAVQQSKSQSLLERGQLHPAPKGKLQKIQQIKNAPQQ